MSSLVHIDSCQDLMHNFALHGRLLAPTLMSRSPVAGLREVQGNVESLRIPDRSLDDAPGDVLPKYTNDVSFGKNFVVEF